MIILIAGIIARFALDYNSFLYGVLIGAGGALFLTEKINRLNQ